MARERRTRVGISMVTAAVVVVAIGAATAQAAPTSSRGCTITGTSGADVLHGTNGDDVICGLGGDDVIYGRGGDDVIYGGRGDDRISGGDGNDLIYGEGGADRLVGGRGADRMLGGGGTDVLVGGKGRDVLVQDGSVDAAPVVTQVSPSRGPQAGIAPVVLTGSNLAGVTGVTFGGVPVSFTVTSASRIAVVAPRHDPGPVDVVVTSAGGRATVAGGFVYEASPIVLGVEPAVGPLAGGQTVTLHGQNLTDTTAVLFGNTPGTVTSWTPTSVTVTTPASGSPGPVVVVAFTGNGVAVAQGYAYALPPTVSIVSPPTGPTSGGTPVTISGTGFTGADRMGPAAVTFDGVPAQGYVVASADGIVAFSPAHAPGPVEVRVTTPAGAGGLVGAFTYVG